MANNFEQKSLQPSQDMNNVTIVDPTSERKMRDKLTINKNSWFKTGTQLEKIEDELKKTTKLLIEKFKDSRAATYDEEFELQVNLKHCLSQTLEKVKAAIKYPTQVGQVFTRICDNTYDYLSKTVGTYAIKFKEVYNIMMQPKENLPKVSLVIKSSYSR